MFDWMFIAGGIIENLTYASAGYFKAKKEKKVSFSPAKWLRTVLTGAIPPVLVLLLGYFGITLPPGLEFVSFLGPALDKLLRRWL